MLSLSQRVQEGGAPYRDFYTLYPPTIYYLLAWLFDWFGENLLWTRNFTAAVKVVKLLVAFLLARKLLPSVLSGAPLALLVLFDLAGHAQLIPYPSLLAQVAFLLAWLLLIQWIESKRSYLVFLAGAACAAAFAFKQPPGVSSALACVAWLVALSPRGLALGRRYSVSQGSSWLLILGLLCVPFVFANNASGLLFLLPSVGAMVVLFLTRERDPAAGSPYGPWIFAAGAALTLVVWIALLVPEMGWKTFLEGLIYEPMKQAGFRFDRSPTVIQIVGTEALVLAYSVAFLLGAILLLARSREKGSWTCAEYHGVQLGLTLCGFLSLTLYPWPTSIRTLWVAAPFLILLSWVMGRLLKSRSYLKASSPQLKATVLLVVVVVGLLAVRSDWQSKRWLLRVFQTVSDTLKIHFALSPSEKTIWPLERAPILVRNGDEKKHSILLTTQWVRRNTAESEPIFVYPSGGILHFLCDRPNPLPYASLGVKRTSVPGAEVKLILELLEAEQVKTAVWVVKEREKAWRDLNQRKGIKGYFRRNYQLVENFGRFRILTRKEEEEPGTLHSD
jgi:hypothetical protein